MLGALLGNLIALVEVEVLEKVVIKSLEPWLLRDDITMWVLSIFLTTSTTCTWLYLTLEGQPHCIGEGFGKGCH